MDAPAIRREAVMEQEIESYRATVEALDREIARLKVEREDCGRHDDPCLACDCRWHLVQRQQPFVRRALAAESALAAARAEAEEARAAHRRCAEGHLQIEDSLRREADRLRSRLARVLRLAQDDAEDDEIVRYIERHYRHGRVWSGRTVSPPPTTNHNGSNDGE